MNNIYYLFFSLIMAFATISGVIRFPSFLYLSGVCLFMVLCIIRGGRIILNSKSFLLFFLICLFSVVYNNPPVYFKAYQRLLVFLIVLLAFSPMISSAYLLSKRITLYSSFIIVLSLFAVGSFFAYFLGINYFVWVDIELDMENVGHFSGLTNHSMVLGPVSAISTIFFITKTFHTHIKKIGVVYVILGIFSFCAVLMSASRGALVAVVAGILTIIYNIAKSKGKIVKYSLGLLFVLLFSFPLWGGLMSGPLQKNAGNVERGGMISSREGKFLARIYEIQNNFFTGVGFASIDPNVEDIDRDTGRVEPSSSWLSVFSMTGIFGFALFVLYFFYYFRIAKKKIPDSYYSNLLCGIMVFFGFHMLVEGYVLFAGNFLCGLFWLTLGVIDAKSKEMINYVNK